MIDGFGEVAVVPIGGVRRGDKEVRGEKAGGLPIRVLEGHHTLGCSGQAAGEGLLVAIGVGGFGGMGVSGDLADQRVQDNLPEDGSPVLACECVNESVGV
ncbi:hypothetical protein [Streptomyces sp. NPDC059378]|uniref:hypothetical protein n=1 Tax=Streptomyces sp. NPDC059378 TaxID=3346815 RepID=UPI00369F0A43